MPDLNYYQTLLYPFQDEVLSILNRVETGFYLTGGTTASRAYLQHRFSDDLDFFVNDDDRFGLWADRWIYTLSNNPNWQTQVTLRDTRFVRLLLYKEDVTLKIEMVNDVPSRVGQPWMHTVLGRIDTAENILANKVTAVLDRQQPKDFADIWGFCCIKNLSLLNAIDGAQGKAIGIFAPDIARVLCSVTEKDWSLVRWYNPPPVEKYLEDLRKLGDKLLLLGA